MGVEGPRFEFRMVLNSEHPRVSRDFRNFAKGVFLERPGKEHPFFFERCFVGIVEFLSVAMPFPNQCFSVGLISERILLDFARVCAETHGAAEVLDLFLFGQ